MSDWTGLVCVVCVVMYGWREPTIETGIGGTKVDYLCGIGWVEGGGNMGDRTLQVLVYIQCSMFINVD